MAAAQLTVAVFMALVANGYSAKYTGDKILRIIPTNREHIETLTKLEEQQPMKLDFWVYPDNVGKPVDVHVQGQDFANFTSIMQSIGLRFKVLAADLQMLMDQQNDIVHYADQPSDWHCKYHPLDEIEAKIDFLVRQSEGRAEYVHIGKSYEERDQLAVKITATGAYQDEKPVLFINCGIHAREWVGPSTCVYMIDQLINTYNSDAVTKATLDKMDIIILPVLNPDGYVYSWTTDRLWRKNRKPTSETCVGVDLNRNFGYHWGYIGSSPDPCSEIFRGEGPMSEVEVRNVAEFLHDQSPHVKGYLDIHSYSQLWMLPWGYKNEATNDHLELIRVANDSVQAIKLAGFNTDYDMGLSSGLLYRTSGSTKDYTYGELHIKYSYVLELRDKGDRGFLLPQSEILPTAMETFAGIKAMVASMNLFLE